MTKHPGCTIEHFTSILEEVQNQPSWRTRADREADYDGNQLDSELLQSQKVKGIPPSIENLIGRTVDDILGMEAKNRTDWKVISDSEIGGDDVADALSQKLNKAERESGADRACTDAHSSQVRVGLGWVEVCREKNPFKFPYRCRFVHRNEIWWDMKSCEPDLSDAMWLLRRRWVNTDIAALMFPGKKDIIKRAGSGWHSIDLATLSTEGGEDTGLAASLEIERGWSVEEQEWRDQETNRVCLFELLTRHYKQALVLKLPDGRIVEFNKSDPLHQQAVLVGMPIISATISDVWKTFFLGPHKLHKEKSEYTHGRFNYVPFWGDKEDRTGVPYGIIRDLMYLQDEVNARISKMQWGLSAVRTERTEEAVAMSDEVFRQSIGRPDADIILNKKEMVSGGVFKVERDFDLNTQQYNRLLDLRESITRVSGVSEAFSGAGGSDTFSALSAQIEQTVQSLARINDNFRYSRQMVGELLLLMLIEDCQEQEEVIVSGGLIKDDRLVVLNAPTIDHDTGVQYLDNDVARTKTKVTLSDVPSTPSFRQQQLSSLSEAFKSAPPQFQTVMMPHLMNLMDVPNKKEIVEAIRGVAQMPTEDEIEQRIKDEVAKALAESDRDLKERELDIKDRLTTAQIEKLVNEAVNKAIDSIYSATQAGREIAATPQVAQIADQILGSAGFVDNDQIPVVAPPVRPLTAEPQSIQNTSPMFPPRVQEPDLKNNSVNEIQPDSPAIGMQRGIEAPENAAVGDITAGSVAMNEEQLQEVMEAHGGDLSDEQMAELLDGNLEPVAGDTDVDEPNHEPEGEQSTEKLDEEEPQSSEPEAEPEEGAAGSEEPDEEKEPVILAKDGKHEIPYQKLVEARDAEKDAKSQVKQWQEIAEQKEKLIEAMKAEGSKPEEITTADTLSESMQDLLEDYPEAASHIKGMMESNKTLTEKIGELEKVLTNLNAENETARHFAKIRDAHEDYETVFQSQEYVDWVEKQPAFLQASIQAVYERGTADQIIEMIDTYKQAASGDTGDVDEGKKDDVTAAVEKKIKQAAAKAEVPASLSDIPGSEAHHDTGEAMVEMSPTALMDKFEGKSQEQIEELLTRVL